MTEEPKDPDDGRIHFGFDRDFLTIPVAAIVPLKTLPPGARESRSYSQVLSSIKAIGLIEAPVVMADEKNAGTWFLLDGHLRLGSTKFEAKAAPLLGGHACVAQWRTLEPGAREACQRIDAIEDVVIDGDDRRKLVVFGYAG